MRIVRNINENWIFIKDCREVQEDSLSRGEMVSLPYTWNGVDGQDGGNDYFRGSCCYVKNIRKSELPEGEQIYLEITGANSSAEAFVNGKKLASHDGGYSTWRVNLTEEVKEENEIIMLVNNTANETVYPQTADFTFYGGLYRDVNLIGVAESHFDLDYYGTTGIKVTPEMVPMMSLLGTRK